MAGSAHLHRHLLLLVALSPAAWAETPVPATPVPAEPAVSPKLTKLFGDTPPKFDPPKSTTAATTTGPAPRNGIIRLPTYIVRETRPISDDDVITPAGREHAMAQRWLGPQSGLDSALNTVTLAGLWHSIPILGKIPFVPFDSMSYDQRAAKIYEKPEKKRRFGELLDIERVGQEIDQAEKSKPVAPPSK